MSVTLPRGDTVLFDTEKTALTKVASMLSDAIDPNANTALQAVNLKLDDSEETKSWLEAISSLFNTSESHYGIKMKILDIYNALKNRIDKALSFVRLDTPEDNKNQAVVDDLISSFSSLPDKLPQLSFVTGDAADATKPLFNTMSLLPKLRAKLKLLKVPLADVQAIAAMKTATAELDATGTVDELLPRLIAAKDTYTPAHCPTGNADFVEARKAFAEKVQSMVSIVTSAITAQSGLLEPEKVADFDKPLEIEHFMDKFKGQTLPHYDDLGIVAPDGGVNTRSLFSNELKHLDDLYENWKKSISDAIQAAAVLTGDIKISEFQHFAASAKLKYEQLPQALQQVIDTKLNEWAAAVESFITSKNQAIRSDLDKSLESLHTLKDEIAAINAHPFKPDWLTTAGTNCQQAIESLTAKKVELDSVVNAVKDVTLTVLDNLSTKDIPDLVQSMRNLVLTYDNAAAVLTSEEADDVIKTLNALDEAIAKKFRAFQRNPNMDHHQYAESKFGEIYESLKSPLTVSNGNTYLAGYKSKLDTLRTSWDNFFVYFSDEQPHDMTKVKDLVTWVKDVAKNWPKIASEIYTLDAMSKDDASRVSAELIKSQIMEVKEEFSNIFYRMAQKNAAAADTYAGIFNYAYEDLKTVSLGGQPFFEANSPFVKDLKKYIDDRKPFFGYSAREKYSEPS